MKRTPFTLAHWLALQPYTISFSGKSFILKFLNAFFIAFIVSLIRHSTLIDSTDEKIFILKASMLLIKARSEYTVLVWSHSSSSPFNNKKMKSFILVTSILLCICFVQAYNETIWGEKSGEFFTYTFKDIPAFPTKMIEKIITFPPVIWKLFSNFIWINIYWLISNLESKRSTTNHHQRCCSCWV